MEQSGGILGGAAFDAVATFLEDALWEHPDVTDDVDVQFADGFDMGSEFGTALDFDGMSSGLGEAGRVLCCEFWGGAGSCREIGDDGAPFGATCDRFDVVEHVGHRHACGVWHAEDDHSEGVADEDPVHGGFVDEPCGGIIVSREDGEPFSGGFSVLAVVRIEVHDGGLEGLWLRCWGLPLVGCDGDSCGVLEIEEQDGYWVAQSWWDEVRTDVVERLEDEATEVESRMREEKVWGMRDDVSCIKDV